MGGDHDAAGGKPLGSLGLLSGSLGLPLDSPEMPSFSAGVSSGSVGMPSLDLSDTSPDTHSVGRGIPGDLLSSNSLDTSGSLTSGGVANASMPPASLGMPHMSSAFGDMPCANLSGKSPDMPSVGGDISDDRLPSGDDAKMTGPAIGDMKGGGGVLIGARLAAGVTVSAGATIPIGVGLPGEADELGGEVRACVRVFGGDFDRLQR